MITEKQHRLIESNHLNRRYGFIKKYIKEFILHNYPDDFSNLSSYLLSVITDATLYYTDLAEPSFPDNKKPELFDFIKDNFSDLIEEYYLNYMNSKNNG